MFISVQRSVYFGPGQGTGPREVTEKIFMPGPVLNVVSGLSGFSSTFSSSSDGRPFGRLVAELFKTEFSGNEIEFSLRFGLRDWSGDWDDTYEGLIDFAAFVEVSDNDEFADVITINGLEYNQAIQFFRTHLDLGSDMQMPNNAIPLVARKATAVRIYADFNPPDGIFEQDQYEGEFEVTSSVAGSEVFTELLGVLNPRRDTPEMELTSGQVPHFVIPAEMCAGNVTVRGRLRVDRPGGALDSGWSPFVQTELDFIPKMSPKVFLVGLNYLGDPDNQLDGPAGPPTPDEAQGMFDTTLNMFPIPGIEFTGFQTADIFGPGESSTFDDRIFDILRDIRGDATDEYFYGLLGPDFDQLIPAGEGSALGGSAITDESIAWSTFIAGSTTVSHEMGHLVALGHAPGHEEGQDPPEDIDENFPRYGSYSWGSIGQHGIDTSNSVIQSPSTFDFMSYKTTKWISPYHYSELAGRFSFPSPEVGKVPGTSKLLSSSRRLIETLFLSVDIGRQRSVSRTPSFHFPAPLRQHSHCEADFEVELADDCRNTLNCCPLTSGHSHWGHSHGCWPRRFYAQIPYLGNPKWLLIWEGKHLLYEECITEPPSLDLRCEQVSSGVQLNWDAGSENEIWYLVQWKGQDGKWRGLGPKTQQNDAFLPGPISSVAQSVRVLATSGIATTVGTCDLTNRSSRPSLVLTVLPQQIVAKRGNRLNFTSWRAVARDSAGRNVLGANIQWFDEQGRLIAVGSVLSTKDIPPDAGKLSLVARNLHGKNGTLTKTYLIKRTRKNIQLDEEPAPNIGGKKY